MTEKTTWREGIAVPLDITPADIEGASRDGGDCPVARALRRTFGAAESEAGYSYARISWTDGPKLSLELSATISDATVTFVRDRRAFPPVTGTAMVVRIGEEARPRPRLWTGITRHGHRTA
jgi:hypothetical protein